MPDSDGIFFLQECLLAAGRRLYFLLYFIFKLDLTGSRSVDCFNLLNVFDQLLLFSNFFTFTLKLLPNVE